MIFSHACLYMENSKKSSNMIKINRYIYIYIYIYIFKFNLYIEKLK